MNERRRFAGHYYLPLSSPLDLRWFPTCLVAVLLERGTERTQCPKRTPLMLVMDAGHLATHVQRPRLGPKDLGLAEREEAFALAYDHCRSGFTMLQSPINWTEVHPSDLCVNPGVTN